MGFLFSAFLVWQVKMYIEVGYFFCRKTNDDQVNVQEVLKEWNEKYPGTKSFFRQHEEEYVQIYCLHDDNSYYISLPWLLVILLYWAVQVCNTVVSLC